MIKKEDVIKMLDEWLERLDESDVSEAIECVLLMVKNKIENMPEQKVWIPVSERLPEAEQEVLLQFEDNMVVGFYFVEGGRYDGTTNWYGLGDNDAYTDCDAKPIAWMPLPDSYIPKCEDKETERQQSAADWKESMMGHFTKVE